MTEWLDYGITGVLALVLFAVGKYMYDRDRKMQDFLQALIVQARDEQKTHTDAWREMMQMAVEAQKDTSTALREILASMERHETRVDTRVGDILDEVRRITPASVSEVEDARPDQS